MRPIYLLAFAAALTEGCGSHSVAPVPTSNSTPSPGAADVVQGTSAEDMDITKQIHTKLVSSDLSAEAQRVSVSTLNGKVTLQGNLTKQSEMSAVEDIAKAVVGPDKIVNKLEVSVAYPLDYEGNPTYRPN